MQFKDTKYDCLSTLQYLSVQPWSPMIFHNGNLNNKQTQNCNQNDTVCNCRYYSISNVHVCRDQYLQLFQAISAYICIKFSVSFSVLVSFLVLDVKQPKIQQFHVIEVKIFVFTVFEAPTSRPSKNIHYVIISSSCLKPSTLY